MVTWISSFSQIGLEKSYEILCKTFDSEAKSKLEVRSILITYGIRFAKSDKLIHH
jgi:hypothetical protein